MPTGCQNEQADRGFTSGTLYFWMKDLTQEFLKLHVIAMAVEILDKVRRGAGASRCSSPVLTVQPARMAC